MSLADDDWDESLPCGWIPGDCCAAGIGCDSCGNNPACDKEDQDGIRD